MRTTVLVPLHRSAAWYDSLADQLKELREVARIIVSDRTGEDDTLARLRAAIDDETIGWIGPRDGERGWVAHCNDLGARALTEFVMWLPHDDRITRDWIREAEAVLDAMPDAVAACGPIVPLSSDSSGRGRLVHIAPFCTLSDAVERSSAAVEHLVTGQSSELGILFRSVVRLRALPTLPPGIIDDDWSDLLWAIRLLTRGQVAPMTAVYGKRWHDTNTHGAWGDHALDHPDRIRRAIATALDELPSDDRASVLTRAWIDEVARYRATFQERESYWQAVLVAYRRDVEASASWRATAPARSLVRALRRLHR